MMLSVGEYLRARRMRSFNLSDEEIARKLGNHTANQVREALAPSTTVRKPRPSRTKVKRVRVKTPKVPANNGEIGLRAAGVQQPHAIRIPHRVLVERERAYSAAPRSLTAAVFGDPPAGRSALDKKRATMRRSHVEMRSLKYAPRQYVSETHDHKPDAPSVRAPAQIPAQSAAGQDEQQQP